MVSAVCVEADRGPGGPPSALQLQPRSAQSRRRRPSGLSPGTEAAGNGEEWDVPAEDDRKVTLRFLFCWFPIARYYEIYTTACLTRLPN